jgi:hypothetical protein
MAAKIDQSELNQAEKEYCELHSIPNMEVAVSLKDGKIICEDANIKEALVGLIMEQREPSRSMVVTRPGRISSRSQAGNVPGSALETVRRTIDSKDQTYSAGGNEEAYAAVKIKAFEEMGGSYAIVSSQVTPDSAIYRIRGTLPDGRYNESEYAVFQEPWQRDMAWDMVDKQMEAGRNIIDPDCPSLENGMPNLVKGAMMKIKKGGKKGDVVSGWMDVPAAYHIATTVNKMWKFQRIQAQTKCKAKIAKEMAGAASGMLDDGEIADENREREQIEGSKV